MAAIRHRFTSLQKLLNSAGFTAKQVEFLEQLMVSVPLVKESKDSASLTQQGLVRLSQDQDVIDKVQDNVFVDQQVRVVQPYQLPDTNAEDSSIVVTEVIWNVTDSVVAPDTTDQTKVYRKRYLAKTNPATTPQFDTFLSVIGQTIYTLDGTLGMPDLTNRNIQLLTYATTVMSDDPGVPVDFTFVSATGVLTFTFGITDICQIKIVSTG